MGTLVLEDRVLTRQRFRQPSSKKSFDKAVAERNGVSVDLSIEDNTNCSTASEFAKFYEGVDAGAQYRDDFDDDNDDWIPIDNFKESVINHIRSWIK